ncbi:hypothetical protein U9M48_040284 [Paspalum notatum var. saurae]|uniref:Uncharacterized protein n=1 Tax=Paspalum notatum var. saurae TaxID=547442 RepID=A0AAQ3UQ63_PASNO
MKSRAREESCLPWQRERGREETCVPARLPSNRRLFPSLRGPFPAGGLACPASPATHRPRLKVEGLKPHSRQGKSSSPSLLHTVYLAPGHLSSQAYGRPPIALHNG